MADHAVPRTNDRIAVIIACYSWPALLPQALASIATQTVMPDHIIAVLDGPGPQQANWYLEMLEPTDVDIVWLSENRGTAGARNAGVQRAHELGARWYCFLDEDDLLYPWYTERMHLSIQLCPDRSIHYCDWVKFGAWHGYTKTPEYNYTRLLQGPFIINTSVVRTQAWLDVLRQNGHGFDPEMRAWEDYLFFLEAGALGHLGARVGQALVRYRKQRASSVSDTAHRNLPAIVAHMRAKLKDLYDVELLYQAPVGGLPCFIKSPD